MAKTLINLPQAIRPNIDKWNFPCCSGEGCPSFEHGNRCAEWGTGDEPIHITENGPCWPTLSETVQAVELRDPKGDHFAYIKEGSWGEGPINADEWVEAFQRLFSARARDDVTEGIPRAIASLPYVALKRLSRCADGLYGYFREAECEMRLAKDTNQAWGTKEDPRVTANSKRRAR